MLREQQLLVNDRDAELQHPVRVRMAYAAPEQLDRAAVGDIGTRQDLDQRRLAGAVLADQRQHLARRKLQIDRVQRDDAREALGDLAHREDRRAFVGFAHAHSRGICMPPSMLMIWPLA